MVGKDVSDTGERVSVLQFICSTGFYGAERWIAALVNNLDRERVTSHLAVTEEQGSDNSELIENCTARICSLSRIPMRNRFDLRVIFELCKVVRKNEVSIIHTHGYKSDLIGLLVAKLMRTKIVSTPHGFEPGSIKLRILTWIGAQALKRVDLVAALSAQIEDQVKGFGVARSKIRTISNGVDLSEIYEVRQRRTLETKPQPLKIGYIGRLVPLKNTDQILSAHRLLRQTIPDAELHIVGAGELYDQILQAHGQDGVQVYGFRKDRLELLANFDLLVLASETEGTPRSVMEAMGMGVPVVAYDIPGVRTLIEHRKTGMLATYGSSSELARFCIELARDRELAKVIAINAMNRIEQEFSGSILAARYASLYLSMTHSNNTK